MAFVITVAQQKGGAGKTTLAANLAVAFASAVPPRRVALLDIDRQPSLAHWRSLRAQAEVAIPKADFQRCEAVIGNRVGVAAAFGQGLSVAEFQPRSVASRELAALAAELRKSIR